MMTKLITGACVLLPLVLASCTSPDFSDIDRAYSRTPTSGPRGMAPFNEPKGILTLDMALKAARLANPDVRIALMEVNAAHASVWQAGVIENPELSTELEEFGGSGDTSGTDAMESTVGISQTIQLGGKRKKRTAHAEQELRLTELAYAVTKREVEKNVRLAFSAVAKAQKQLTLAQENLDLIQQSHTAVVKRVKSGDISPLEKSKVDVSLASATVAHARSRRQLAMARRHLASFWGKHTARFTSVLATEQGSITLPPLETMIKRLADHPMSKIQAARVKREQAGVVLAEAESWPDLEVGAGVSHSNESNGETMSIGLSIPVPFFNRNQGEIAKAKVAKVQAELTRDAARATMERELISTYEALQASLNEHKVYQDSILPAAQRAYNATLNSFNLGEQGLLNLLESQRTLLEVKHAYLELQSEVQTLTISLEESTGSNVNTISPKTEKE